MIYMVENIYFNYIIEIEINIYIYIYVYIIKRKNNGRNVIWECPQFENHGFKMASKIIEMQSVRVF